MPARAREPSGRRVEVLCGQPEQKNGFRTCSAPRVTAAMLAAETRVRKSFTRSMCGPGGSRSEIASATSATDSELSWESSGWPCSSTLPMTRGWACAGRS